MLIDVVKKQTDAFTRKPAKKATDSTKTKKAKRTTNDKVGFIASKNGSKYHKANSPFVNKIKEEDRVYFSTEGAALKKGYTPSKFS